MGAVNPYKRERYETLVLQEAGMFLRRNISDPRLKNISITHVELNSDYSEVLVYWDTFDFEQTSECEKAVNRIAGAFRHHLSKVLKVRIVPIVKFKYNSQYISEQKITDLLNATRVSEDTI